MVVVGGSCFGVVVLGVVFREKLSEGVIVLEGGHPRGGYPG